MSIKKISSPVFLFVALFALFNAHASTCDDMRAKYNNLEGHADNRIIKNSVFSVSSHVIGRSKHEACAIVSFFIDANGKAREVNAISYFPSAGVGETAKLYLNNVDFKPDSHAKYILYLNYNKFSLSGS